MISGKFIYTDQKIYIGNQFNCFARILESMYILAENKLAEMNVSAMDAQIEKNRSRLITEVIINYKIHVSKYFIIILYTIHK